jgi:ribosomal protein L16 Arg81 hydroxylase
MNLSEILPPAVSETAFFEKYWRSRFLYAPQVGSKFLSSMPELAKVRDLINRNRLCTHGAIQILTFPKRGRQIFRTWLLEPDRQPQWNSAESVNVQKAETIFPELLPLANALRTAFACDVNLQLFISEKGTRMRVHSDLNDSFAIQLEGTKLWNVQDVPRKGRLKPGNGGGRLSAGARSIEMSPGDVLYKPSNALHDTLTTCGPCLSLTASLVTFTARQVLADFLNEKLAQDQAWLERFPLLPNENASRRRIERACRELDKHLPTLDELEQWWSSRNESVRI